MRVAVVLGTRPEAIKLVPLIRAAKERDWDIRMWWSGQHDDMVQDVLQLFQIVPDVKFDALSECESVSQVLGYVLDRVDRLLESWKPELLWVQGDTTTALAGALAGFHRRCPVGHVEAGLRTYDVNAPFPEEANRQLITRVASLHYAPTQSAHTALIAEGVPEAAISVTGNTGIDALVLGIELSRRLHATPARLAAVLRRQMLIGDGPSTEHLAQRPLLLVTTHRRENHGAPLRRILDGLRQLALERPDALLVYPVHPNPIVMEPVLASLGDIENVCLTRPLSYSVLCAVMAECSLVVTDSGGLQEEAVSLGIPVVVLREKTERPEGVEAGLATLAGHTPADILGSVEKMLARGRTDPIYVYGDGKASPRILDFTEARLL
jgi:UDP-N-acetylglucosamine 2-epimerase (non-hydrolysing)